MSYFKMHRGWQDSDCFNGEAYSDRDAWVWMIGEAQWKDGIVNVLGVPTALKRAQFSHSVRFMAAKFKWSKDRASRFLKKLERWGMIESETATGQTIITICNYEKYQGGEDAPKDTSKDTGKDAPKDSGKDKEEEVKEVKEGIGGGKPPSPPKVRKNGTRIPDDWECSVDLGKWAMSQGLTREKVLYEIEQFTDHWRTATGKGSTALDWDLKFKTWIRNSIKWQK